MVTNEKRLVSTDGEENVPRVHARLHVGSIQMQGLLWKRLVDSRIIFMNSKKRSA